MRSPARFAISLGMFIAAIGGIVAAPVPAFAEDATAIAFIDSEAVTADFASDWVLTISVTAATGGGEHGHPEVNPSSGTVDVYVDGIAGAFASALPVQANGIVYFAQPATQPLLAAGTHSVRAIFNPEAGSRLLSSQTTSPATLTITPLTVDAAVTATMDSAVAGVPIVTGSLTGGYVDAFGGAPAGIWTFAVRDAQGETVFTQAVAQEGLSTDPVQIGIDAKLPRDAEFVVTGEFTPDPSIAAGLVVTQAPTAEFTSAAATVGELLVSPVPAPMWAIIAAATVLVLMVGVVVWLAVLLARRRRSIVSPTEDGTPSSAEGTSTMSPLAHDGAARTTNDDVVRTPVGG